MKTTLTAIRQKLELMLYTIKPSGGFTNTLPPKHIYPAFSAEWMGNKTDKLYPKVFLVSERGAKIKEPAESSFKTDSFLIVVVVKAVRPTDDTRTMTESWLEDIEKLLDQNESLSGIVHEARVDGYSMDSGFTHPEGVVVMRVTVESYYR